MATDISSNVIKSTQESLGKFVKKPALSEKLLRKPPFRFLHDIVTAVIKNTGFFQGLFTDEELVSENVKDRESKIAFLQKVIQVVNIVTDSALTARPSKIIAGLEPEKTNELLQKIGLALEENLNSTEAVVSVTGSKTSKPSKVLSTAENKDETVSKITRKDPEKNTKKIKKENEQNNKISKNSKSDSTIKTKNNLVSSKEKSKVEVNDKKVSKKPLKSDVVKKSIPIENDIKLKPSKSNEVAESNEMIKNSSLEIINNENGGIPRSDGLSKVELKDIIDDSDDATSKSQDIAIDSNVGEKVEEVVESKPLESNDMPLTSTEEKYINFKHNARPQSGVRRQQSSKSKSQKTTVESNLGVTESEPNLIKIPFGEELQNGNGSNGNHQSIENSVVGNKNGSGDSRTHSVKTASSRRSAKKIEPLKATKSISIESRSDADIPDMKSLSSESEYKEQPEAKTTLRPPSVRPSSARPGAPRLKDRNTDVVVSVAEPVMIGKVHVIVENYDNQQEDDEESVEVMQIVTEDNIIDTESWESKTNITSNHGHLVQQILETQKELSNEDAAKVQIEWEYGARREREASYQEMESIRSGLQSLSRASNPLGKLMDYIQEDVEVMRQELMQWRDARLSSTAELKHQHRLTEQQIQPLEAKLKQLQVNIAEQTELIHTVKSNIHRNSQRIIKLVDGED